MWAAIARVLSLVGTLVHGMADVEVPEFHVRTTSTGSGTKTSSSGEVSIEDLLRTSVYVTSKRPQSMRETPGVVSVITRDEIVALGARDLVDVLQLVPGFFFGVDVEGAIGIGFRGNWGHEGKVLLLIDGHEMNELGYSTTQYAGHFPVEDIERIEIIRGPGSAVYGGFAELAVINVVTRTAHSLNGLSFSSSYGEMGTVYGHRAGTISTAGESHGVSFAAMVHFGQDHLSDRDYTDANGMSYSFGDTSVLQPLLAKVNLAWKGLKLSALYDGFQLAMQDGYGTNTGVEDIERFTGTYLSGQYDLKLGESVTLTPHVDYKLQTPWQVAALDDQHYNKSFQRLQTGLASSFDLSLRTNLSAGVDYTHDSGWMNDTAMVGQQSMFGSATSVEYDDFAAYAQLGISHPIVNLTAGARFELHSKVGQSFVPRVGLTKVMGRFHVKLLAALAFRAPGIENINLNPGIKPEHTTVFEVEAGVQLSNHAFVSANAFDTTINDAIIYTTVNGMDGYFNSNRAGTRGVEAEAKIRYPWGFINGNASYYTARGKNEVDIYAVPSNQDALLGAPQLKVALAGAFRLHKLLSLGTSLVYMSERYAYTATSLTTPVATPATLVANLFLTGHDLGVKGLEAGLGVANLFDADQAFIEPYNAGHPPLPGPGREFLARLSYTYGF